jgi:hypothetical protein
MNAPDRVMLSNLTTINLISPERKALTNLWALLSRYPEHLEPHDLRYCEIVLEGLGVPERQRRKEVEVLIQAKRDWLMQKRAARIGGDSETS